MTPVQWDRDLHRKEPRGCGRFSGGLAEGQGSGGYKGRRRGGGGSIIQVDGTARPKAPNLAREMDIKPQEA